MTTKTQDVFLTNIVTLMDSVYTKPGYSINVDHHVDVSKGSNKDIKALREAKLSLNLNLFKDGVYLTETPDYAELGQLWKSLNQSNIWGGDLGFGCIFAMSPTDEVSE